MRFEYIFYQLKSIVIVTMNQYKFVVFEEKPIVMHCCVFGAIKNVVNNFFFVMPIRCEWCECGLILVRILFNFVCQAVMMWNAMIFLHLPSLSVQNNRSELYCAFE